MRTFASIVALVAGLAVFPALSAPPSASDNPVVLTGGHVCVGPACVGRDRDHDWRYRHHHGYGWDRGGCRDVTIRRDDGSVTHVHRCD
jgi:hypothetical protein